MGEKKWGCPMCGCGIVTALVQVRGTQDGGFDDDGNFNEEHGEEIGDPEIDEIAGYHCTECEEDFDNPGLVYGKPGARMRMKITAEVIPLVEGMDDQHYVESDKEEVKPINLDFDLPFDTVETAFAAREGALSLVRFLGGHADKEGK